MDIDEKESLPPAAVTQKPSTPGKIENLPDLKKPEIPSFTPPTSLAPPGGMPLLNNPPHRMPGYPPFNPRNAGSFPRFAGSMPMFKPRTDSPEPPRHDKPDQPRPHLMSTMSDMGLQHRPLMRMRYRPPADMSRMQAPQYDYRGQQAMRSRFDQQWNNPALRFQHRFSSHQPELPPNSLSENQIPQHPPGARMPAVPPTSRMPPVSAGGRMPAHPGASSMPGVPQAQPLMQQHRMSQPGLGMQQYGLPGPGHRFPGVHAMPQDLFKQMTEQSLASGLVTPIAFPQQIQVCF